MKVKYACQTPDDNCGGGLFPVNNLYNKYKKRRLHSSPEEAFICYERYLLSQGFLKVGSREFKPPQGPVVVLSKKSHYGAPFRYGKEKQNYLPWHPGRKTSCHGTIVG